MPLGRRLRSLGVALIAAFAAGCGGGAATLHPAHVLPEGRVSAGAGASGQFVFTRGEAASGANAPTGAAQGGNGEQQFLEGAVKHAALAPGIAPWVGARAGIGGHNEAGLTYTGRSARIDARHAFGDDTVAVSVGAGASAVLAHIGSGPLPAVAQSPVNGRFTGEETDLTSAGFGFDIPVIVGWRSAASVVEAWAGARGGFERAKGDLPINDSEGAADRTDAVVTATRWYAGGLVGAALGFRPFSVALELDVAYQTVSAAAAFPQDAGNPSRRDASISGLSLAPTGAIIGEF